MNWERKRVKRAVGMLVVAIMLGALAPDSRGAFVPGKGRQPINPVVSVNFDEPWGFETNLPASTQRIDGQHRLPYLYSTNTYVSPMGAWNHSIDGNTSFGVTNVFNTFIEDPWNGAHEVTVWTNSPAGGTGGALAFASKKVDSKVRSAIRYETMRAVIKHGTSWFPTSQGPSIVLNVYVPDPATWQAGVADGSSYFGFMSYLNDQLEDGTFVNAPAGDWWGDDWPMIYFTKRGAKYTVEHDGADVNGNWFSQNYTHYPHLEITEAGWWTIGASIDGDGALGFYARSGIVELGADDFCGDYDPKHLQSPLKPGFTRCYGLFDTFGWMRTDSTTLSPCWIVDNIRYYHVYHSLGTVFEIR